MTSLLSQFGEWSAALTCEHLPAAVVARAKLCFLDYVGVALRAEDFGTDSTRAGARQIRALLAAEGQGGDALVLGSEQRLSLGAAVLMNAYLGQATSLDDTALRSMSHPACAVIPAVIGCAARKPCDGATALAAVVAGYEAMIRVGRAIMPGHAKRGFHVTATTAPFGAAAAAARIMGLDARQTMSALAIAGDLGAGLQEALFRSYAAGKFAVARAVQSGVLAACLAADGMAGAPALLEGPEGFLRAMSDAVHPERVCAGLGSDYEIEEIGFKFHSGCRHWHAAVDAIIALRKAHGLVPDDVAKIHFATYGEALRMNIDDPPTGDQARLCTAFAVAQALLGQDLITGDLFCDAQLARPEVRAIMARVTHALDPDFERRYPMEWPVRIEVQTRDGRQLGLTLDKPLGEPGTTGAEAIVGKFMVMAQPALGAARAAAVAEQVQTLETRPSVTPLLALVALGAARGETGRGQAA